LKRSVGFQTEIDRKTQTLITLIINVRALLGDSGAPIGPSVQGGQKILTVYNSVSECKSSKRITDLRSSHQGLHAQINRKILKKKPTRQSGETVLKTYAERGEAKFLRFLSIFGRF